MKKQITFYPKADEIKEEWLTDVVMYWEDYVV